MISYLAAGFRGASAELSGGEFVTTEIVCGAGDGESRRVGVEEYFSLLKVGRFTTEMFMQCSRYFGMLVCEVDGQMLTARLSLPSALSYLFNSDDGAVQSALALLDECLKFI